MRELARSAEQGREALMKGDWAKLARLMDRNHELRVAVFGETLGSHNLELVEIARARGFSAKLPGSSGAALVLLNGGNETELAAAYAARGYCYQPIEAY
jgi:hypothetical protein